MAIDPRGADLKLYQRYVEALRSDFLPRYGGEVLCVGDGSSTLVGDDGQSWDTVLIVRYPSREAFSRMVADPEYQRVIPLRTEALTEAVLQATVPWAESTRAPA
jgi:uncharacterized protein (DUF1330 family)